MSKITLKQSIKADRVYEYEFESKSIDALKGFKVTDVFIEQPSFYMKSHRIRLTLTKGSKEFKMYLFPADLRGLVDRGFLSITNYLKSKGDATHTKEATSKKLRG